MPSEKLPPEGGRLDLKSAAEFVRGGIVSKELLETDELEVDLFCLSTGQALSEHTSTMDALLYVMGGRGKIMIGEMSFVAEEGGLFYFPANVPHSVSSEDDLVFLLTLAKT
ncbi:MAG: cupin domain-containing protein [Theionarchaea archaeon]|nr:cupin domain-containing protein [Theionarchaea archaeon]